MPAPALRRLPRRADHAGRSRQPLRPRRGPGLRVLPPARLPLLGVHRADSDERLVRRVALPQADGPRRRAHDRPRAEAAPPCVHHGRDAARSPALRHAGRRPSGGVIERGPGRHGVSNAFFVYLRDPDGHRIELFTGDYYTGDPDHEPIRWSASDARRRTFWGPPRSRQLVRGGLARTSRTGRPAELAEPTLDERLVAVE